MEKVTYLEITAAVLAGGTSPITFGVIVVAGFTYESRIDALTDQVRKANNYNEFQANAFGHAYAAAEIGFYLGHNTSKNFGDFREYKSVIERESADPRNSYDNYKDLYNNEIGRQIGAYAKANNLSINDVQDLVISAINQGQLIRSTNDPRINQNFSGLPRDFDINFVSWKGPNNSSNFQSIKLNYSSQIFDQCFLAGTKIELASGLKKNIEEIVVGDTVASFNPSEQGGVGRIAAKKVSKIFRNFSDCIIDLRGLFCTPGHVFLSGENCSENAKFKTIAEILLDDGCIVMRDGAVIRARTGDFVGSFEDKIVEIVYKDGNQQDNILHVRAGIPIKVDDLSEIEQLTSKYISLMNWLYENAIKINADNKYEDSYGNVFDIIRWPEARTPFENPDGLSWIVKHDDQMYTPPWIKRIKNEDSSQIVSAS